MATRRTAVPIRQLIERKLIAHRRHPGGPTWGERRVGEITKGDVIELIEAERAASGVETARQVLVYAKGLFAWAAERDLIAASPCTTVRASRLLPPKALRERILTDRWTQIEKLAAALLERRHLDGADVARIIGKTGASK